jgi:hypothetical protein
MRWEHIGLGRLSKGVRRIVSLCGGRSGRLCGQKQEDIEPDMVSRDCQGLDCQG